MPACVNTRVWFGCALSMTVCLCSLAQAGPADLRHFDPEFTQEAISASITRTPDLAASSSSASDAFLGFSYAPTEEDI